ncbi:3-deoxy-D-manno-octulosonic-acid transferase [Loktanella ponticola]|uniref:3-deoxy-D-manno-octulosonic acid transferase n=1 Tax=Yoonia ponticola TaxID=1524255 RepID=A0A7W9BH72_9RHOB|nr:glycosyltransferase N-terminal domain-containing protein [Yoonia ponticola]MBB5720454.1 3-deoxy-D-manno-octulosonic-acid transferase [Yoonia ponticola]
MADTSLSLAAYFSRRGGDGAGTPLADMPPRPVGNVIWVRGHHASQLDALSDLELQLQADGDPIHLITTLPTAQKGVLQTPTGRAHVRAFLNHWTPDLVLWLVPTLDTNTVFELAQANIPCILVGASKDTARPAVKAWVPGLTRAMLRQFVKIMTLDADVNATLIRAGADANSIETLGALESAPSALPHFESERQDIATTLGARSIWFAADTDILEIPQIAKAHHQASRRAHRLLLIVSLRDPSQGTAAAEALRDAGFTVALRSADEEADTATQVYVADTVGELGLWYRVAPITYLGGSLSAGPCRDPFEAATLGSAVLHGPNVRPYESQIQRLATADACVSLRSFSELGQMVETLLSPDKTARIVHAAWDVTSRGADVTNRLAEAIHAQLDKVEQ